MFPGPNIIVAPIHSVELYKCDDTISGLMLPAVLAEAQQALDHICDDLLPSGHYSLAQYLATIQNVDIRRPITYFNGGLFPPATRWKRQIPQVREQYHNAFKQALEKTRGNIYPMHVLIEFRGFRDFYPRDVSPNHNS